VYEQIASNKRRTYLLLFVFLALLWGLALIIGRASGHPDLLFGIGIFSLVYAAFSYFAGAKMALAINGAHEITKKDNPRLWRTVENAFATGRDYDHAVVCATSGLLEVMNDTELQGVIAHELGHVKNYDMRVNTLAFALVGVISLVADFFIRFTFFGGNREERENGAMLGVAIVAAVLAPVAATLLQLAISRRREYLADATGALTTRYPEGLADALEEIEKTGSVLRKQNTSTAHMFFANPLSGHSFLNLFSTHPPIQARIKALREMKL